MKACSEPFCHSAKLGAHTLLPRTPIPPVHWWPRSFCHVSPLRKVAAPPLLILQLFQLCMVFSTTLPLVQLFKELPELLGVVERSDAVGRERIRRRSQGGSDLAGAPRRPAYLPSVAPEVRLCLRLAGRDTYFLCALEWFQWDLHSGFLCPYYGKRVCLFLKICLF